MKSNSLTEPQKSLPFNWYYEDNFHKKELDKIFYEDWIYVCHVSSIKNNHFRTIQINNKNIVVIKDRKDQLSLFYNSCSHRGSQIFQDDNGTIKTPSIICPYHQWSYSISDGSLLNTTSLNYENFDKKKYDLKKVNFHIWKGLIFINLNNEKIFQYQDVFQYFDSTINKIHLEDFEVGHIWKKIVKCNWKIYWENYSECLHCPNIHPELSNLVPLYQRRLVDIKDHPEWVILKEKNNTPKFNGGLKTGAQTWSSDGSSQGFSIKDIEIDLEGRGQVYLSTWPSMFLGIYGDHIRIVRLIPRGPEEVELSAEWLFEKDTLSDPAYDKKNVIDFGILVMNQDASISEINQKGLYNFSQEEGVLMPEEYIIKDFQDYIKMKTK